MPTIPFRGLAAKGIVRDVPPYQLPPDTFSAGSNVRFHGGVASRSPIFRTVVDALPFTPLHAFALRGAGGTDAVFMLSDAQTYHRWAGGTLTDVSPLVYTPAASSRLVTSGVLGQVAYINDFANVPVYFSPASTEFAALPGWASDWRCRSLRPFQDYLVALNVTKGSTAAGNMVKWSDIALNGLPPSTWDHTDPSTSAGENPLADLRTPLVDGLPLRGAMVLYANSEIWAMEPTGDTLIFGFRRLFSTGGMISPNCAVEASGKHYVFGPNDIYVHDGTSKQSLVDGRDRAAIFSNLNRAQAASCFVVYQPQLGSILFAYPTASTDAAIPPGGGCNKGLVIDVDTGTTSFVDLPNVYGATEAAVDGAITYSGVSSTMTYATAGGTYWSAESSIDAFPLFISAAQTDALTSSRLLGYDFAQRGLLTRPACTEATYPAMLERTGLSLDTEGMPLEVSKLLRQITPLATVYGSTPLRFQFASSNSPSGPYTWGVEKTFDPATQYKVDTRLSGRFLGIRLMNAADDWDFSGFDADVLPNGS